MMEGDRSEGEAYLERGLQAAPDDAKARLDLAASYLAAGDAKRALRRILATVPDKVGGEMKNQIQFIALARLGQGQGRGTHGGRGARQAQLRRRAVAESRRGLARVPGRHRHRAGISSSRRVPRRRRTPCKTRQHWSTQVPAPGNLPAARQAFEAAIAADPKQGDAYVALATHGRAGWRCGAGREVDRGLAQRHILPPRSRGCFWRAPHLRRKTLQRGAGSSTRRSRRLRTMPRSRVRRAR